MKPPEIVQATPAELDEIMKLAKASFPATQYELLERILSTFEYVMVSLQNARTSIKRLRQMLFGARTERKRDVLAKAERTVEGSAEAAIADGGASTQAMDTPPVDESTSPKSRKSRRGHGRIAASSYEGASIIELACTSLHSGDRCPQCERGRVYDSSPRTIVMVKCQPPLVASIYKLERLRCRLCDAVYSANLPPEVAERPKYDASCASRLAVAAIWLRHAPVPSAGTAALTAHATARCDAMGHHLEGTGRAARGLQRTEASGRPGTAATQ